MYTCVCMYVCMYVCIYVGHAVAQWLRPCDTNRKVAGSIPDVDIIPNRNECQVKGGWCVGLTTLPPSCADCLKIWEPQPPGTLRVCQGL